jgi:GT2 family glycosyltransferase
MGDSRELIDADVSVIIVNYRTPELTKRCLAALREQRREFRTLKGIVVDGGSGDHSAEELRLFVEGPDYNEWLAVMALQQNGGFAWANNQAILSLAGEEPVAEFIYLLNPDAEVTEGALAALVDELQRHPEAAAAGSRLLNPDGTIAASAFRFPSPGRDLIAGAKSQQLGRFLGIAPIVVEGRQSTEVDWVTGASVMFRTDALRATGLFDDGFFLYFEEVELMHRLRSAGWTIRHVPASRVIHNEGASTGLGSAAAVRSLPRYWYESRRRYFTLSAGAATLWRANAAWIAGRAMRLITAPFRRSRTSDPFRAADLFRFGFFADDFDFAPSRPAWGDSPGRAPAWMARK